MKIIRRGQRTSDQPWRGTCRACGSEAMATRSEMTHITHDKRENSAFSWEKCPVCRVGGDSGYGGMLFYPVKE
jgi:hypothetical protein